MTPEMVALCAKHNTTDPYVAYACEMFNTTADKVTREQRYLAKERFYNQIYGASHD